MGRREQSGTKGIEPKTGPDTRPDRPPQPGPLTRTPRPAHRGRRPYAPPATSIRGNSSIRRSRSPASSLTDGEEEPTPTATARSPTASSDRVTSSNDSRSSSGSASHSTYAHDEKSAPSRLRHCETPTIFRSSTNTSPGPRPAKQTRSPNAPGTDRPVCTDKPPCPPTPTPTPSPTPTPTNASTHHCPTHSAATETSCAHRTSSRAIHASIQRWLPGSR